jgi:lactoylglutathione lyase
MRSVFFSQISILFCFGNQVHKPPLNHIGLWVDDLALAVEWMKQQGVRFTPGGIRKGAAGYDVTFIHPKAAAAPSENDCDPPVPDSISGNGVLVELVQAPPEIIAEYYNKK